MSYRVLDVGCNSVHNPEYAYRDREDLEVVRLDADAQHNPDIVHDITQPLPDELTGAFDVVYCSHLLEHISWRQVLPAMNHIAGAVKPGGELVVIVPDLEWACRQILAGRFSFGVLGVFYGGQMNEWEYHRTGFTESGLRAALKRVGFKVKRLVHEPFLSIVEGQKDTCYQMACIAERDE